MKFFSEDIKGWLGIFEPIGIGILLAIVFIAMLVMLGFDPF